MIKFNDRVEVISESYCCAELGEIGTIVDEGYPTRDNDIRYLVRWDYSPTTLFGVHSCDIKKVLKNE